MSAIFKREFNAYFSSPIGYVFIAMFYYFTISAHRQMPLMLFMTFHIADRTR